MRRPASGVARVLRASFALFCLCLCAPVPAQPRAVLILFDGLTADDLASTRLPALRTLVKGGAVGLVNTASGPGPSEVAAVLAMAAGRLVPAQFTDGQAFEPSEIVEGDPAAIVYHRRTGVTAPMGTEALHLGIAPLIRRHLAQQLPSVLARSEGAASAIAVCGNADAQEPSRPVALFGMDEMGILRNACLGPECLMPAPGSPWGVRDNVPSLLQRIARWTNRVVVVQLGDGARVEALRPIADARAVSKAREAALATLEQLLEGLQRLSPPPRRIAVVSPRVPGQSTRPRDRLALAVLWGEGVRRGVLTSATTRTRGLIANVDVEPTLLQWIGLRAPALVAGHPVRSLDAPDATHEVLRLDRRTLMNQRALVPLFLLLGGILILTLFGAAGSLAGRLPGLPVQLGILALMNMPLGLMLAALLPFGSPMELIAGCLALMVLLAAAEYAAAGIFRKDALIVFAFTTGAAIVADALLGLGMVQYSVLSSYQIQGIRYYGIGNEYMGVLIGVALLWTCVEEARLITKLIVLGGSALLLGAPWWGENAGGFVAACVAFGSAWRCLSASLPGDGGRRFGVSEAIGWSAVGLLGALAFAAVDRAVWGTSAGHMGAALAAVHASGWRYAANIAWRKVLMNLRIASQPYTIAATAGAGAIAALAGGALRGKRDELAIAHPNWWRMRGPCLWSGLAAFVFNDSGVVPALFIVAAFLLSGLYYALDGPAQPPAD
ncbi:MAG: hypothetical protein ACP5VE_12010 [Chthonomonadales bacterium]